MAPRSVTLSALVTGLASASAAALAAWRLAPNVGQAAGEWPGNFVVQGLVRWDAGWYEQIARLGYWYRPGAQSPVAFFPLYPMLLRAWVTLGVNVWLAGIVTTAVCGFAAIAVFFQWARDRSNDDTARWATLLLIVYPFSIYLYGIVYSDALYLLLAVSAFTLLERGKVGLATALGALATAARPIAPALVLGLWVRRLEWRRARGERLRLSDALPLAAGLGFLFYVAYQAQAFGDPLAFVHVQSAPGWDQGAGWRSWLKVTWFAVLADHPSPFMVLRLFTHAGVTLGMLALVPVIWRRVGKGYALYVLLAVGMPALSSKDFMGMGRYALAAFPVFLALATLFEGRPAWRRAWLVACAVLLLVAAAGFGATKYVS